MIRTEAITALQSILKPGDTVYTNLRHVSRSGMSRVISLHVARVDDQGKPYVADVTYRAAIALDWKMDRDRDGIKVTGAGMDMGFHAVYSLSRVLHGDGYALSHRWV